MNYEVKTYKYICDLCKATAFVQSNYDELPKGWRQHTEGGRGTHHDKNYDYCEGCYKVKKNRGEVK